ncbi:unnamed protein product [Urochloa decumbens]|uniref:DUF674 family protein n=1 Tax=Urochloa decumbens TaxID=240449 RepID=A0ABC8ZSV4_9POAL
MKLLVDTKAGRVLYAEASKDVVDFLFSLLTLPVGTVVKILSKDSMVGSVGNLYGSVENLDDIYVRSARAKQALLSPAGGCAGGKLLQLPEAPAPQPPCTQFYRCQKQNYTDCYNKRDQVVWLAVSALPRQDDCAGAGFVQGIVTYTVMDDLKLAPMSTISGITLLNTFGITDIGTLQEKTVKLGYDELEIDMAPTSPNANSATLSMMLLVDTKAGRVLYAEASKDVVDFIFSLLALPVGTAVELLGKESMVGCVGNVYASVETLDDAYVQPGAAKSALLHPTTLSPAVGTSLFCLPAPPCDPPRPTKFFRCRNNDSTSLFGSGRSTRTACRDYVTDMSDWVCPSCDNHMNTEMTFLTSAEPAKSPAEETAGCENGFTEMTEGLMRFCDARA